MSESFWINNLDENQLRLEPYIIVPKGHSVLSIINQVGENVGSIEFSDLVLVDHVHPLELRRIDPHDISYIFVRGLDIGDGNKHLKFFLREYFSQVREFGGTAAWYYEKYKPYDHRDTISVFDLDSLIDVYNRLPRLFSDRWDESIKYNEEFEEDEVTDEFGLTTVYKTYRYSLPPEIRLAPQTWAGLVEEAVGKYEYIDPLAEVPCFIMDDRYQQFSDVENDITESFREWIHAGDVRYMLSVVYEISNHNRKWAGELWGSIVDMVRRLDL